MSAWRSTPPTRAATSTAGRSTCTWGGPGARPLEDLVVLDQRIGQQRPAHLVQTRGILDLQLDQPADAHVVHALKAEGGQCALDRLALGVEDARLGADQDLGLQGRVRSVHAPKGSPAISS